MVNRKNIFLVLFLVFGSFSFAQMKFGATFGANYNKPSYSMSSADTLTAPDTYQGSGVHGGLYYSYSFSGKEKPFGVQADLLFSTRQHHTSTSSFEEFDEDLTYARESFAEHKLVYFDLPIQFRYNLNFKKGKFGDKHVLSFLAGPQISFALSDKYEVEHTYILTSIDQRTIEQEVSNRKSYELAPFEFGLSVGVQFETSFGLRVGARYYRALTNMAADNDRLKINNQMVMAYIGFNFASIQIGKY